jgi:transcriptional regulator GlxA family with amidase domain
MNIAIPLFDGVTALDAIGPYEVLSLVPGLSLEFVAARPGLKFPASRIPGIEATVALSECLDPDVIVVPGGTGVIAMLSGDPVIDWIRHVHASTIWTTSVCTGSLLLGAAGVLDGIDATTHWNRFDLLATFGARPIAERVVERGKVITAGGVSAGIDMALTLAARLSDEVTAQAIQLWIEYDPQPPFDSGSPLKASAEVRQRALRLRAQSPSATNP